MATLPLPLIRTDANKPTQKNQDKRNQDKRNNKRNKKPKECQAQRNVRLHQIIAQKTKHAIHLPQQLAVAAASSSQSIP